MTNQLTTQPQTLEIMTRIRSVPISGPSFDWKGARDKTVRNLAECKVIESAVSGDDLVLEKLIDASNLLPIAVLDRTVKVASAVGLINIPGKGVATGFMISHNLMMTNNHVFGAPEELSGANIVMNYQRDINGQFLKVEKYEPSGEVFITSPDLDVTVFDVKGSPGLVHGHIDVTSPPMIFEGLDVIIIQHPGGQEKQVAMSDNDVVYVDDRVIHYLTDTLNGSSGAPITNDKGEWVGLHHAGGLIPEPATGKKYYRNEGISGVAIAQFLKDHDLDL